MLEFSQMNISNVQHRLSPCRNRSNFGPLLRPIEEVLLINLCNERVLKRLTCFANCGSEELCDRRAFDLDVDSCNKAVGCSYYQCSGQCHATGTSNCAAGCC